MLKSADAGLAANKQLVFDMWRSIVNAGRVELADEMLQEGYIQHSPVLPTGRAAFKRIFSAVPRSTIPDLVSPPLVAMVAEGDRVVMALRDTLTDPTGEQYTSTHFNMFRIEDGRLAEHWHSLADSPGADVLPPEQGGPQPVTGIVGTGQADLLASEDPELAVRKRLAYVALRDLFVAGGEGQARDYLTKGYGEHDPNGFTGREQFGQGSLQDVIGAPLVAVVAEGNLVVLVTGRVEQHPFDAMRTYTTTRFDMFRIESGRIAEHWSGSVRPGQAPFAVGSAK
ncbi:hypothetical protein GRI89_10485 [Altererythrobacter salegens]|uniref:SnoaL-like domain-containing protein n=1 Tax=Croceibacterium salegens TaxID=1737568 RepID=A0A6I4SYV7_9SPHN|nr:nuclear transport factor 2 family protein [Croceibacterium salegens]MXO59966.1 hypothetical protein [Croceibacterium salegens]